MSNLEKHAEYELERAGLFKKESDYGGMLGESTMRLIKCFAEERHSGFSASMQIHIFNLLANFKALTPLTDDPNEWNEVESGNDKKLWQNRRQLDCFSEDGGKTYYSVDDKQRKIVHSEKSVKE